MSAGASPLFFRDERLVRAWRRLRGGSLSPSRAALSVAVGLFVGAFPIYGFQLAVVLAICLSLRLDAAVAYLAAHVANPITAPFLIALEAEVGSLVLTHHRATLDLREAAHQTAMLREIACGSCLVALGFAAVGGTVTWIVARSLDDAASKPLTVARRRTLSRYAGATRPVRGNVAGKLFADPALEILAELGLSFGRVVDAGSGYGQLGLALVELGRATSVYGFDADGSRIAVASAAAGSDGAFEENDLATATFPDADTVLFFDSLHYLDDAVQDGVLARAAAALSPGGRIIVREVNAGASLRSKLTELLERVVLRSRKNPVALRFRTARSLADALERRGLTCTTIRVEPGLLDNALIVAERR